VYHTTARYAKNEIPKECKQARNEVGTLGGLKSFMRGPNFLNMYNTFLQGGPPPSYGVTDLSAKPMEVANLRREESNSRP